MKILAICGSPRKGDTEFMMKTILDSAKEKGAETELILLKNIKMEHCRGDSICMKKGKCIIDDDVAGILNKMLKADVIIFGSPSYFDNVTGLMKDFIDRMHPIVKEKQLKGKKGAVVAVGQRKLGSGSIEECAKILKYTCEHFGMDFIGQVLASSAEPVSENKELIDKLKKLGESL